MLGGWLGPAVSQLPDTGAAPGEAARADGRMQVASANETVVVQEAAPLVQTDNPTIGQTIANAVFGEKAKAS